MGKRILLCDDEIHILRAAEFKFVRAGFEVSCASDGEQAWASILESRPDLLITDCQMPRLDGMSLCRRVRECAETADLPIIMLTAKGFELMREDVTKKLRVSAVISKPFSPRELLQMVEDMLADAPAAAAT